MSTSATDLAIGDIITAADPQNIGDVIEIMTAVAQQGMDVQRQGERAGAM